MTRVGEEVGNLEQMLKDITIHMEKEAAVTSKVRGAMIYPTFVIAVAVVAAGIVFGFVIPALSGLFEAYGGDLPIFTRMMLSLSDFVNAAIMYIVLSLACLLFLGWWYFKTPAGKRTKDSIVWRLPVMGKIVVMGTMSRLARTLAVLIRGGITLTEALELVIQTTDHAQMKEALVKVHSDVHAGVSMSQALQEQPVFPPLFGQVVAVGEQSGRLEANLETMADFYETETDRAVSRATSMLGPLLIIGVGVAVGFIALSVITPIYDLMGQIE
jgi:type IV pilus assembly protein PilC